ncbi:MAG: class I SAM-dependent methyltransferase [Clostridia bacterium]|jgi:2-polyprenyl-3-methyl-5-hydroxy-6-metoxy-1,4-benzoquinol methylase
MMDTVKIVKDYYDEDVLSEWKRIDNRPEFLLTCRYIDRYVKAGDKVIDIGGGPGRYSLYLAAKGCDVTLFDLSKANVEFASERAKEAGLALKTVCGDARKCDRLIKEQFDHVLLMGPMYHLLNETDREKTVNASLSLLKPGGTIFVTFINMISGIIYAMKFKPDILLETAPEEIEYYNAFFNNTCFKGKAFTEAVFDKQNSILPFMAQFPLEKLHLLGQESITSPCEKNIMTQPKEVIDAWMDLCEKVCEREDLLSWSEHLMYIGRKI